MGNAIRSRCEPSPESDSVGHHGVTVGVSALAHDLYNFEITKQVPQELGKHVVSSRKAQSNWFNKLSVAWRETKPPPKSAEEASRLVIQTLKRHQKADVEGLLAFYGLPLPHSLVELTTMAPLGHKSELHTIPVDPKAVADGDRMTVYATDSRESSNVEREFQVAAIERDKARAQRNYARADELHQQIIDLGYREINLHDGGGTYAKICIIRRRGIDAPESKMPFGQEAKEESVKIVQNKCVSALSESSSFSSNEDDSSGSMTEPMSSISSNERYGRVIHDWQKGELLGRGTFGSVYEGIADGGFFFAVKEVSLLDQGDEGRQCIVQLEQEIALVSQFEHENIVRYYGTEKDGTHLYIFLELVSEGSLLRLYRKYDLRVPQVSGYTRQILHGLKYLHDRNVIHRDIKCANILVHTNGLVKLADFGLAKAAKVNDVKSCKGTVFWMAPEVVRSKGYGLAADIWSLGCTVLEMLTRRFPYHDLEYMTALYKIGQGEGPEIPDSLSSDARDFILQCLQVNPSLRPTASQLLDHPFVKRPLSTSAHSFGWHF